MPGETSVVANDVLEMAPIFRLQFEQAQSAWVLLYPEGMVKLSASAGEIMRRVDGVRSADALIRDLQSVFPGADLANDVLEFLEEARGRGWIRTRR